jgi:hypothetical protein
MTPMSRGEHSKFADGDRQLKANLSLVYDWARTSWTKMLAGEETSDGWKPGRPISIDLGRILIIPAIITPFIV